MKRILLTLAALSLAACSTTQPPVHVVVPVISIPPVAAPKPDPLVLNPVHWKVYNSTELKALGEQLTKDGGTVVLFTLDEPNFKTLNDNLVSIKSFIQQQDAEIDFYAKAIQVPTQTANEDKK